MMRATLSSISGSLAPAFFLIVFMEVGLATWRHQSHSHGVDLDFGTRPGAYCKRLSVTYSNWCMKMVPTGRLVDHHVVVHSLNLTPRNINN